MKEGQSKALVDWRKPEFDCAAGGDATVESTVVNPPRTSPSYFAPGQHVISYTYKLNGGVTVTCPVTIDVIGEL